MNNKPRILCVDDEPSNLKLLEALLAPRGYEVIKTENGTEALEKINEGRVDLVLLDVMMPGINGYEVCRKIKEDDRYKSIPVVMITALQSKEDRIKRPCRITLTLKCLLPSDRPPQNLRKFMKE